MTPSPSITVYKLDEKGRDVWQYAARVLACHKSSIRLEAFFDRPRVDIGPVTFEKGDRFVETFYSDRWYNVFAVYGRETGRFKGWYCNICRPAEIGQQSVRCEDLALDVWVAAHGEITVLDEEVFSTSEIPDVERDKAEEALQEVYKLASQGALPK